MQNVIALIHNLAVKNGDCGQAHWQEREREQSEDNKSSWQFQTTLLTSSVPSSTSGFYHTSDRGKTWEEEELLPLVS